jgi:hypothetical protein
MHIRCRRAGGLGHPVSRISRLLTWSVILASSLGALPAAAQSGASLFGRATDEASQPVQNVAVTLLGVSNPGFRRTVLSDASGAYRMVAVPAGSYRVRADRLGYRGGEEREISLERGESRRFDIVLSVDTVVLEGVVVEGRRDLERERARFETDAGVTARVVEGRTLRLLPGLAEADVLRAVELLPGVVSTSDFSSAFHVRGGSADQNLFLLDGFPIYNPFHLGGLFGVFNGDAIERAELLAGGFGAEYGGRVSSVLNVESRPAGRDGLEVSGGISLLASRLLVGAPLPAPLGGLAGGEGGSWFLSARRSYFDQILRPVVDFPYHLSDLQARMEIGTAGDGRISLTGYTGRDVLDLSSFQPPSGEEESSILRLRWSWGNSVSGLRWEQPLGAGWLLDSRAGFTRFDDSLGFLDFDDVRFSSEIEQWMLRSDLSRDLGPGLALRTGLAFDRLAYANRGEAGGTVFFDARDRGVLLGGYGSLRWAPGAWIVEPGLRADSWRSGNATHTLLSPRFAAKRFFGESRSTALKLAVGRYTQFLHSLRNEELPVSNDTWIAAGEFVPPVVSDQVQLGVETFRDDGWSLSLEAYFRDFRGVTEFNIADDPHGVDLLIRRTSGPVEGWIALSYLRATRTLPDPLAAGWSDLPPETTFSPIFDRRLDLDLVAQYTLPREIELGARFNYGSPLPYTRPVAQHVGWRYDNLRGRYEPVAADGEDPSVYVVLGERNAERYPPYHRLDVTIRRAFERSWGSWTPYLQVLNVYNRRNVLFYFYNYDSVPPTRSGLSMFPVLPAVGVEVAF